MTRRTPKAKSSKCWGHDENSRKGKESIHKVANTNVGTLYSKTPLNIGTRLSWVDKNHN